MSGFVNPQPSINEENWETLVTLMPENWVALGKESGAIQRLREFKSPETLMRVLLLHLAKGYSLKETATRAAESGLISVSDVAILKRLKKSEPWFRMLATQLISPSALVTDPKLNIRIIDATVIHEPGKTGSNWRLHYSLSLPQLNCEHFEITPSVGDGNGESFTRFPVRSGELYLADRAYCTGRGLEHVIQNEGHFVTRLIPANLRLHRGNGERVDLLPWLKGLKCGRPRDLDAFLSDRFGSLPVRVCAVKKTNAAIRATHKKISQKSSRQQTKLCDKTLEYAKYVLIVTSLPKDEWPPTRVLELYRSRWQIELAFKRFKSIANLGHLPKHDEDSIRAWLAGKIFVALLTEKLVRLASSFSPWGLESFLHDSKCMA